MQSQLQLSKSLCLPSAASPLFQVLQQAQIPQSYTLVLATVCISFCEFYSANVIEGQRQSRNICYTSTSDNAN